MLQDLEAMNLGRGSLANTVCQEIYFPREGVITHVALSTVLLKRK